MLGKDAKEGLQDMAPQDQLKTAADEEVRRCCCQLTLSERVSERAMCSMACCRRLTALFRGNYLASCRCSSSVPATSTDGVVVAIREDTETVTLPQEYRSVQRRHEQPAPVVAAPRAAAKRLPPLPTTADLLKLYRLRARKQLSQNFLLNPRVCDRFVAAARIKEGSRVLEIGPGPGNITRRVLERNPAELFVVEKDRRFLPMLEQLADAASPGQMKIVLGDCLDYSFETLFPKSAAKEWSVVNEDVAVLANLPFAVSIPLLVRWLRFMSTRSGPFVLGRVPLTLTFQKEVALRLRAPPLSMFRSRISIMAQAFCKVEHRFFIKGASFTPEPKVDVGVVRLVPREVSLLPPGMDFQSFEKFVRCFVHYRRFSLHKNLADLFPKQQQHLMEALFRETGYSEQDLPLMLSTEEVCTMAGVWFRLCQENPGLLEYDYRARKRPPRVVKDMFRRCNWA